jgi:putative ABC transport system substrate-binding protein
MFGDLSPKRLEFLLGMVPGLSRVAVLLNLTNPYHTAILKNVQGAARTVGIKVVLPMEVRNPQEIENAFAEMARQNAGAVFVAEDPIFLDQARQIAGLAAKGRLPSISGYREYAEAGGLMSYGPNLAESCRRAATYVDKIFKGAKPGDLPIEQPTKFELVVNRKTARALGIKIPQSILLQANQVIE